MTDFARLVLDADTKGLKTAQTDLMGVSREAGRTAQDVGRSMQKLGVGLTVGVTAPIAAFGAGVISATGDFQSAMNNVAAISGATGVELQNLSETAKEMGATTQFSASQAADALGFLAMAGFNATEATEALPNVLALAAAGGLELAEAADIASNVLSGFGLETAEASRVSDVLAKAASSTNTNIQQLGGAMSTAAPIAAALGISLEETAAAIGVMSDAGIQGERAGTALRGVFASLAGPTTQAEEALSRYGLTAKDIDPQTVGLANAMALLNERGLSTADAMTIFGREAASGALVMADQSARLKDLTGTFEGAEGAAQDMADIKMAGFNGQMAKLNSAFEGLQIAIGESGLLEDIGSFVSGLADTLSSLSKTNPTALKFGVVLAGIAAAAGPVIFIMGSLATAVSAISGAFALIGGTGAAAGAGTAAAGAGASVGATGFAALALAAAPWIALAAGIAAAGYLIYDNWDIIAPVFEELGAVISSWYNDSVKPAFDAFTEAIGPIVELFVDHFGAQIKDTITLISQLFTGDFSGAWDTAKNIVNRSIEAIISIVGTVGGAVYDAFVDMANRAAGALREFAGDMVEIGSNIIAGLINGIKSGATAVYNALTNIVQTGYNNVKEFLGIQSPSRLFMSVGSFIGAGLAQGIENSQPVVDEAFAGLTTGAETVSNGVVQSFEQMAQGVTRSVSTLANSIKDGGFLGILEGAVGLFGQLAGSGIFGSSLQTSFGGAPSFNGGGFTGNAPRSGGLDGQGGFMAMLHPRETVVDHTRGQSSGQSVVVINNSAMAEVFVDGQIQRAAPAIANAGARVADANNSLRQSRTVRR